MGFLKPRPIRFAAVLVLCLCGLTMSASSLPASGPAPGGGFAATLTDFDTGVSHQGQKPIAKQRSGHQAE